MLACRQRHRLPTGGRIDRSAPRTFTFNGRRFRGVRGGHSGLRPARQRRGCRRRGVSSITGRGALSAAAPKNPTRSCKSEAARTLTPNLRATQVELYDGLQATSVNCWPSVSTTSRRQQSVLAADAPRLLLQDVHAAPGFLDEVRALHQEELRAGVSPVVSDPDHYEKMNAHCEVLVVGGGPAGLAAALAAGSTGARVILVDDQPEFGGRSIERGRETLSTGYAATDWVRTTVGIVGGDAGSPPAHAQHSVRILRP